MSFNLLKVQVKNVLDKLPKLLEETDFMEVWVLVSIRNHMAEKFAARTFPSD